MEIKMGKHKDTLIDDITPENIPEVQEEYADPLRCKCGGTFVLVGRSQDAKEVPEVYECDLCKAKKQTDRAKG
jgi:predicted SprT family Zn-dependent metalloprotease